MRNILVFSLVIVWLSATHGIAKKADQAERTVEKSISIDPSVAVKLSNKFGDIQISTWDKPKLEVTVSISIEADKKAQQLLEDVEIKIDDDPSDGDVSFITQLGSWSSENVKVTIDYQVNMPRKNPLEVSNQYGDLYLGNFDGELQVEEKFGNLQIGNLSNPRVKIELAYGGGSLGNVNEAEIELSFVSNTFRVGNAKKLDLESKYSKLELGNIDVLNAEFKFGNLEIEPVGEVDAEMSYSGVEIEKVTEKIHGEFKFCGNVTIDEISAGFKEVDIYGSYSHLTIGYDPEASFSLEAETRFGSFKFKESEFNMSRIEKDDNSEKYAGTTLGGSSGSMKLESSFGSIKLGRN